MQRSPAELIVGDTREASLKQLWAGAAIEGLIARQEQGDFPDVPGAARGTSPSATRAAAA
jgi:hypothetical protein